jgi:hypothetical protein
MLQIFSPMEITRKRLPIANDYIRISAQSAFVCVFFDKLFQLCTHFALVMATFSRWRFLTNSLTIWKSFDDTHDTIMMSFSFPYTQILRLDLILHLNASTWKPSTVDTLISLRFSSDTSGNASRRWLMQVVWAKYVVTMAIWSHLTCSLSRRSTILATIRASCL